MADEYSDDEEINTSLENLTGTYSPIQVIGPLAIFLSNVNSLGPIDPIAVIQGNSEISALLNELPLVRNGLMLRSTIISIMYLYFYSKGRVTGTNIIPDQDMIGCFGGNLPAAKIVYNQQKLSMSEAVTSGYIQHPLNTFDVIQLQYPNFNRNCIKSYFLINLVSCNIQKLNVEELAPATKEQLRKEYELVKLICGRWGILNKDFTKGNLSLEQKSLLHDYSNSCGLTVKSARR